MGLRGRPGGEGWHEHLRGGWVVAQRGVRAHRAVVTSPALDDHLRLPERGEDLTIEQFVSEPGLEAFDIAVLPWAARGDGGRLGSDRGDTFLPGVAV